MQVLRVLRKRAVVRVLRKIRPSGTSRLIGIAKENARSSFGRSVNGRTLSGLGIFCDLAVRGRTFDDPCPTRRTTSVVEFHVGAIAAVRDDVPEATTGHREVLRDGIVAQDREAATVVAAAGARPSPDRVPAPDRADRRRPPPHLPETVALFRQPL